MEQDTFDTISEAISSAAKPVAPPPIDHLPDAIVKDPQGRPVFLAHRGDKIVIERYATVLNHRPWLDTKTYTVEAIEESTGVVHLYDEELHRNSSTNYLDGSKNGYRFKLANTKGATIGQRKRGRPRKNPEATATPKPEPVPGEAPKKRGRPKGAKNRPKEVIAAEKKAKADARAAKPRHRRGSKKIPTAVQSRKRKG